MLERETVIAEFWRRLAGVTDVKFTARNPSVPPDVDKLPIIQFFEMSDRVARMASRGASQKPIYQRELDIVAEVFIMAEAESSATNELALFVREVKKALFVDGVTLGGKCAGLVETETGRILRPPIGGPVVGVGLSFRITYNEDVSQLFT